MFVISTSMNNNRLFSCTTVTIQQVRPRRGRQGTALDAEQNEIAKDSSVKAIDGPNKV